MSKERKLKCYCSSSELFPLRSYVCEVTKHMSVMKLWQHFPSCLISGSSVSALHIFKPMASFLRYLFWSSYWSGALRKGVCCHSLFNNCVVCPANDSSRIVIELSKDPLGNVYLVSAAVTLANLFSWLWCRAGVTLEFGTGFLCHRGRWSC